MRIIERKVTTMTITLKNFKSNFSKIETEELMEIIKEFNYNLEALNESFTKQVSKFNIRCEQCDLICDNNYCYSCEHYSTYEKLIKSYKYRGFKVKVHTNNQKKNTLTRLPKNPIQYRVFDKSCDLLAIWRSHEMDYNHPDVGVLGYYPLKENSKTQIKREIKRLINKALSYKEVETPSEYTKRQRRLSRKIAKLVSKYGVGNLHLNVPKISKDEKTIEIGCRCIKSNSSFKTFKEVFTDCIKKNLNLKMAYIEFKKALL